MYVTRGYEKLGTEMSFNPLVLFTLAKPSFTLGWTIHPVKKHCCRLISKSFWILCSVYLSQESLIYYTRRWKQGITLPIICLRLPGTRYIRFVQTKLFFTSICALSITFHMCTVNHKQNFMFPAKRTCRTNFRQDTTKQGLFRDFLFVCRKRHARVRFVFFRLSHGVGRLITYKV